MKYDYFPYIRKSKESSIRITRNQADNKWLMMKLQAYFASHTMLEMIQTKFSLLYLALERERRAYLKLKHK